MKNQDRSELIKSGLALPEGAAILPVIAPRSRAASSLKTEAAGTVFQFSRVKLPFLALDLWEHDYYQNKYHENIDGWRSVVNRGAVEKQMA